MPAPTLKIENARYALTLDDDRRVIRDASILVEGQRITRVGKAADLAGVGADRVIDGRRYVVTPGFFNGHMHISYAHAVRGIFPDDIDPPTRLFNVFNLQAAMTEEEEYLTTLVGILELIQNGTTTFLDPGTTRFPDACLQAYQDSGIRVVWAECVNDLPARVKQPMYPLDECLSRTSAFVEKWHGKLNGRMSAWAMAFSAETATVEVLQGLKRIVDERGVGLTMHHSASAALNEKYQAESGVTLTEHLENSGVLGKNVLLAHCIGLGDAELDAVARSGASATTCPVRDMKEGAGIGRNARTPQMLERGIPVVLGSDSANSSNHLDPIRTANMLALQWKDARFDVSQIPAETALETITINGARAFGLQDSVGSIEVGKKADLVLLDTRRPEWQALFNPLNNLIYNADGRSVDTVIVDGRVVVEGGKPTFADADALYEKLQTIGESLLARTGITFPLNRWPIV